MTIDWLAALIMGLAGSGHCLAMCGGLAAAMGMNQSPARLLLYNLGRISSYAIAGLLISGALFSVTALYPNALIYLRGLAGVMMILLALYLIRWNGALIWLERLGAVLWRRIQPLTRKLPQQNRRGGQIFLAGMLWGWLPCGLVYSALAWAALSANPVQGAGFMLIFGLGTFPAMFLTGVLSHRLSHIIASKGFRWIAGLLLLGYGIATLWIAIQQLQRMVH
ncbi:sulfite exporter TauE/SafE family protein [Aliidiomarina haloalkalitolerans]|uniref:Sulfite exporter TauE/SafE family protein n=1 Tax=Aliidiomarina haloalkalitolerans TaxID=859059 RepID=A0A432VYG7_9GAMM|nr:sulfite exporter TauE/SafE family protein [Aliidiomarina haloalkalitolerans]RUO21675.1 sulfite exporter TauE/SafE family protein [Aliidiomarina haloalkalitolerans]